MDEKHKTPPQKLLIRVSDVAEALSVARSKAYQLIHSGDIPSVRLGKSVRVSASAVAEYVQRLQAQREEDLAAGAGGHRAA